jgi:hypothetical protein
MVTLQPPQEFFHGVRMQDYLQAHPLTQAQIKQNRVGLLKLVKAT